MLADVMFIKCPLQEEYFQALERFWKEVVESGNFRWVRHLISGKFVVQS
jgi:hypothetical protein